MTLNGRRHSDDTSRIPVSISPGIARRSIVLERSPSLSLSTSLSRENATEMMQKAATPLTPRICSKRGHNVCDLVNGQKNRRNYSHLDRHRSLQSLSSTSPSPLSYRFHREDDEESFGSGGSSCDHAHFAHNGTTYSERRKHYIVHCSPQVGSEEYLTPTQRANKTIRTLKMLLSETESKLEIREQEIARLTKEAVELRLLKADGDLSEEESPPQPNNRGDAPLVVEIAASLTDSGHFEEPIHNMSKEASPKLEQEQSKQTQCIRERSSEELESLLMKIAEGNQRYYDLKKQHETSEKRIRELEQEIEAQRKGRTDSDVVDAKGQEKGHNQTDNPVTVPVQEISASRNLSIPELLHQLEVTQQELHSVKVIYRRMLGEKTAKSGQDPESTLQFLKSAMYYFLTDKENTHRHLTAIQSILGYSETEKSIIDKAYYSAYGWK